MASCVKTAARAAAQVRRSTIYHRAAQHCHCTMGKRGWDFKLIKKIFHQGYFYFVATHSGLLSPGTFLGHIFCSWDCLAESSNKRPNIFGFKMSWVDVPPSFPWCSGYGARGRGRGLVWCTTPPVVWISDRGNHDPVMITSQHQWQDNTRWFRDTPPHMGPCQFIIGSKVYSGAAFNLRLTVTLHREQLVSD